MSKTHTRLFIFNKSSPDPNKTISLDTQINNWAYENDCEISQVSMVSFYMSSTLEALVIFEERENE